MLNLSDEAIIELLKRAGKEQLLRSFMEQLQDEVQRREDQGPHWPDMKHLMVDRYESREVENGDNSE